MGYKFEKYSIGGGGGSGIIDVTELPKGGDVLVVMNGQKLSLVEMAAVEGDSVTIYVVDTLPDIMEPSTNTPIFYILNSTGVAYVSQDGTPANTFTAGTMFGGLTDKGWTDDVDAIDPTDETQSGVYCVRAEPIEEGAVYRMVVEETPSVYFVLLGEISTVEEWFNAYTVKKYLVDSLPAALAPVDETNKVVPIYVVNDTGVGHLSWDGTTVRTLGQLTSGGKDGYDMGWTDDITAVSDGWWCVRGASYSVLNTYSNGEWADYIDGVSVRSEEQILNAEIADKTSGSNFADYAVLEGSADGIALTNVTDKTIQSIKIPNSVTSIGSAGGFQQCAKLVSIIFNGTKEQWKAITFADYWDNNTPDYIITCTDGTIAKDGTES